MYPLVASLPVPPPRPTPGHYPLCGGLAGPQAALLSEYPWARSPLVHTPSSSPASRLDWSRSPQDRPVKNVSPFLPPGMQPPPCHTSVLFACWVPVSPRALRDSLALPHTTRRLLTMSSTLLTCQGLQLLPWVCPAPTMGLSSSYKVYVQLLQCVCPAPTMCLENCTLPCQ